MNRAQRTSKVFVDSSVLIAAAISPRGRARQLLLEGFRGRIELYTSSDVLLETERNLDRKAPDAVPAFADFRELLVVRTVEPGRPLVLAAGAVVALKDAPIVAAASLAGADFLATYDRKHLLQHSDQIREHFNVEVATPEQVLAHSGK